MPAKPTHITPIESKTLIPLPKDKSDFVEADLQKFCYENPGIIPFEEIDPIYREAVPICRELRVSSGFCDIIYINSDGLITLVETKLWRNPEARRKVIGQILDYAKDLVSMSYEDFETQCLNARKGNEKSLFEIVSKNNNEIIEKDFIDHVFRNLRIGRFLLLIAGDGIRENARSITNFMRQFANMTFTLALLEMPMYKLGDGSVLVVPRVSLQTTQIEREVYITKEGMLGFSEAYKADERGRTGTENEFFNRLRINIGVDNSNAVRALVDEFVEDLDMVVYMGTGKRITLSLKDSEEKYNFVSIYENGEVRFYGIVEKLGKIGYQDIGETYMGRLADILNAEFDKSLKIWCWSVRRRKKYLSINEYVDKKEQWKNLLSKALDAIAVIEY